MENGPFKLKSGNKPSFAKMAGVSPMKQDKKMKATFTTKKRSFKDEYNAAKEVPANKRSDMQKEIIKRYEKKNEGQDADRFRGNYDEID
tara:strand:- start:91 stop:357 length:267 start_codon:yes stop_codon:yes gene_type:complete